jgi:hypothetical protein
VLTLAGGVHRSLPAGAKLILSGMVVRNRLAPNALMTNIAQFSN